ncbi:MAG: hypothetical protein R3B95_14430 [Nitrospirales bacterium]|nr:hypothetical protein [Nitrospira sp.]MDR4484382.1 hypothetical protein [Nitrospirales bacterium]
MPTEQIGPDQAVTKEQFHSILRKWLTETDDTLVGPTTVRGRTPWIHVRDGSRLFFLNADTGRVAVMGYLELVDLHGEDLDWEIVPSQSGRLTAVAYGPERVRHTPFYLYFHSN